MFRKIIREYSWWIRGTEEDINPEHEVELEQQAEEYINGKVLEGWREGQLFATVHDTEYQGYWKTEEETVR
jgi:hypothetical protein